MDILSINNEPGTILGLKNMEPKFEFETGCNVTKKKKNRSVQIAGIRVTDVSGDSEDGIGPEADVAVGEEAALYMPVVFVTEAP